MQKDLENLVKEMQKLKPDERLYWLQSMAQCRENLHPTAYPTYKTYNQIEEDFLRFKGIIVRSLSSILTGKSEEAPVIKNGVHAFMSASKEEREEFYKIVQKEVPNKIATKTSFKTDLMRLAKEMQSLSNIGQEFSSDKEYFLYQLIHCRNLKDVSMGNGGSAYLEFKKTLTSALTKKLSKKAEPKTDYDAKEKLVEKGIQAYMEASEEECAQFYKIVHQEPTIVKKSSSRTSHSGKRKTRVRE